ncbi:hypothetical protein AVEN_124978-1 [Araneus ventricosus]|uniref:Uncharacterized protein n=1 Tax=Araneus ventricosus TaxID=182803 RepID=A0A4Y2E9H4_ARAVE|nr:hypothetical protein AVEN_124978-1 [Araneus ventricosus]
MPKPQPKTSKKERKRPHKKKTPPKHYLPGRHKELLGALRDVRILIQEFPTIIEAVKSCKQAKTREKNYCLKLPLPNSSFRCLPENTDGATAAMKTRYSLSSPSLLLLLWHDVNWRQLTC